MKINELLDIKYPLFQGGMAHIATGAFAAAISNAGGLGIIASGNRDGAWLRQEIADCRSRTDKPFGVNIMMMNPYLEEIVQVVAEEHVPVLTTGAGNPGIYLDAWKAAGCKVFPVVSTVAMARRMARHDIDGIIAEGTEAGGHIGELTTMVLVPQIKAVVDVPVIAAGGIASPCQVQAAYALGASGVQVGTCLLLAEECPVHPDYQKMVQKAGATDTIVTGRIVGSAPVRMLKNQMARQYIEKERAGAAPEELEIYTLGSLRRAVAEGDTKTGSVMAGQVVGMCNEILPAEEIIRRLFEA